MAAARQSTVAALPGEHPIDWVRRLNPKTIFSRRTTSRIPVDANEQDILEKRRADAKKGIFRLGSM